jgi:hypothetical protein
VRHPRILFVLALAPSLVATAIPSVVAQDPVCSTWTVGMVDDEGGEVLTAQACAMDRPDAYITLTCGNGTVGVRLDLAAGAEASPQPNEVADVTFATATDKVTLQMGYEEYDGYFAAYPNPDDPLIQLLKAGDTVTINDVPGQYPIKHYSLKGSSAALRKLVADCG